MEMFAQEKQRRNLSKNYQASFYKFEMSNSRYDTLDIYILSAPLFLENEVKV